MTLENNGINLDINNINICQNAPICGQWITHTFHQPMGKKEIKTKDFGME